MKKFIYRILILGVLCISANIFAQVGIGTATPAASSMLDIQSTTKGMLIPRMTTAQRTAIASPGNGLLVFDTTSKSFWFYNVSAWKELVSSSSLVDADGDTKIEVEKNTDEDKIRFSTGKVGANPVVAVERMTIDNVGKTRIGDGANNTYIESDGSLSYEGTATRFEDLKVPVNAVKIGGGKKDDVDFVPAEWGAFKQIGLALLWFGNPSNEDDEQDVVFTVQMPHGWKEGSNIFPHVHWSTGRLDDGSGNLTNSPIPNGNRVTWGLEYSWANAGEVFGASTKIVGSVAATNTGNIALYEHVITPIGLSTGISGSGKTLSSMLVCRLFRNSTAGADTYTGDAGLLEIDFHYEIDADGSRLEYVK